VGILKYYRTFILEELRNAKINFNADSQALL
jgi:hypothetical protein